MAENSKLKQRLVGAVVLVSIGIIFLPLVLQSPDELRLNMDNDVIPPKPPGLSVKVVPLDVPERMEPPVSPLDQAGNNQIDQSPDQQPAPTGQPSEGAGVTTATAEAPQPADTSPARGAPVAWVVQVGSFSDSDNALALRNKLLKQKYAAFVDEVKGPGGEKIFRVRIGPELLRSRADVIRDDLEKHSRLRGIVVRHDVD